MTSKSSLTEPCIGTPDGDHRQNTDAAFLEG